MIRRINSRLLYIFIGCVFLSFILSRLYEHPNNGGRPTSRYQLLARKELVEFDDNMPSGCDEFPYDKTNSFSVSVIVSVDSVASPILTRTISSIISHTDPRLLQEIIITSNRNVSHAEMIRGQAHFSQYGSLVTYTAGSSQSKLSNKLSVGRRRTRGTVVVCVDDTAVVSEDYLTPLLQGLSSKPRAIVLPSTNYIKAESFQPDGPHVEHKWIFDWHLNHPVQFEMGFLELVSRSQIELFPTAVFNGAVFAMYKSYLVELESFRPDFLFVNDIDLSLTSWSCGEGVFISPCSRIGLTTHQPSTLLPKEEELRGRHQIAALYLTDSEYKYAFDVVNGEKGHMLSEEEKLKTGRYSASLSKCPHSFMWFMHHVVEGDVYLPTSDVKGYGQFITPQGGLFSQDPAMVFLLTYGPFSYAKKGDTIEHLKTGQLRMGHFCLVLSDKGYVVADVCNYEKSIYKWIRTDLNQFKVMVNGEDRCISHATDPYPEQNGRQVLMYTICAASHQGARFQTWDSFVWL